MKKLITIIALLTTINCSAQSGPTIHFDYALSMSYATLEPMQIPWFSDSFSVTRLYVSPGKLSVYYDSAVGPMYNISVDYFVKFPYYIDESTINWFDVQSGSFNYLISPGQTFAVAGRRIFNYIADTVTVHNSRLNIIFSEP